MDMNRRDFFMALAVSAVAAGATLPIAFPKETALKEMYVANYISLAQIFDAGPYAGKTTDLVLRLAKPSAELAFRKAVDHHRGELIGEPSWDISYDVERIAYAVVRTQSMLVPV